mgnify:CR=1 FL=1
MLTTQLALALEPLVEESRLSLDYLQMLQGDVVESLRLVIAVDFLQLLVEQSGELIQAGWFLRVLDERLVAALGIAVQL